MQKHDSSSNWRLEKEMDRICDAFESRLRAGERPSIAALLDELDESKRDDLLRELLLLEWHHLDANGTTWSLGDYRAQFPEHEELVRETGREHRRREARPPQRDTHAKLSAQEDTDAFYTQLPAPGSRMGQYVVEEEIGAGGAGIVYRARQAGTDRQVALKVVNLPKCAPQRRKEQRDRFLQEPKAVANLDHDYIVPVYEAGEFNGLLYFSMKLIDGPSLRDLTSGGPIDAKRAARYMRDVALAIDHAHRQNVLHRDIKPGNILVDSDDRPYVSDFGMAKMLEQDEELTVDRRGFGTRGYVSPEQSKDGSQATERSDVYSIGATFYHLLTGRPPFQSSTQEETLRQVREVDPVSPRQLNPLVARDLETICLKCLAKSPSHRYQTAGELASDLTRYLTGEPIVARPVGPLTRGWRWCQRRRSVAAAIGLAAALLIVVAVGGPVWALQQRSLRRDAEAARARTSFEAARLAIQRGRWHEAVKLCDESLEGGDESPVDVMLRKSDALSAMGLIDERESLLTSLEGSSMTDEQRGRWLLRRADTARLGGDKKRYEELLEQAEAARLPPADQAFLQALRAESLETSLPHLKDALNHDPWHFDAFTELLATLLLIDELEELDFYARASRQLYPDDPSTHLVQALAAVAREDTELAEQLLETCTETLSPEDAAKAKALVALIGASRQLKVPWHRELRSFRAEVDPHIDVLLSKPASHSTTRSTIGESSLDATQLARGSRLLAVLPQIIFERFGMVSPAGIVEGNSFAVLPISRKWQIERLKKLVEEKPDAVTYCVLAEFLDNDKKWAVAEQAALTAMTAPTLYTRIRPYACAFAAMQAGNQIFTTSDPGEKKARLDRALTLVKRRLEMGPLDHYASCYPLASVAIEAKDYETLGQIVGQLLPRFGEKWNIRRAAAIAAYHRGDYPTAVTLAESCLEGAPNEGFAREAQLIITDSLRRMREFAKAHQLATPEAERGAD